MHFGQNEVILSHQKTFFAQEVDNHIIPNRDTMCQGNGIEIHNLEAE